MFTELFMHFIDKTNPSDVSHTRSLEVLELAREKQFSIVSLPPHRTQNLQLSNKTFMSALDSHYSQEIFKFLLHSKRILKAYDISELFDRSYL